MVNFRSSICSPCDRNPQSSIAYAWFLSIVLVVIAFICACAAAAAKGGGTGNSSLGFAVVWTVLLMIVLSVGGSLVMRKYRTQLAVGFFLGVVVIISQQMLILFAIFVDYAGKAQANTAQSSYRSFAAFSFFLFVVYGIFAWMLAVFREDLIADDHKFEEDIPAGSVPPAAV